MTTFLNRVDAGRQLGQLLREKGLRGGIVLGIPRGGVTVAAEVARALGADLGVVVARKLGAPHQPELGIGAVTADGALYVNERVAREVGAGPEYIAAETERQVHEAQRREEEFDGHRQPPVEGRDVVVVDDGIATGATAVAALRAMRSRGARRVTLAVPVGPPSTITAMQLEADDVVCLHCERDFYAVGQFYADFRPVEDADVLIVLESFRPAASGDTTDVVIERDGVRLAARLLAPDVRGPWPCVLFVHGLGSSKDSPRNVVIAEGLRDHGIASLLFDLNGHGDSTTDPNGVNEGFVADVAAAWSWATSNRALAANRIGISGSSIGGVVALHAAREGLVHPAVFVLRAPPIDASDVHGLAIPTTVVVGSEDHLKYGISSAAAACPQMMVSVVEGASHLFEEPGTLEEASRLTIESFEAALGPANVPR